MPNRASLQRVLRPNLLSVLLNASLAALLPASLLLAPNAAHAQSPVSRSLGDEMKSANTATQRMLELVKATRAQEQAMNGFGPATAAQTSKPATSPTQGRAVKAGAVQKTPEAAPEAPMIWFMAGAAGRLVVEVVYKQRVHQLTNSAGLQTVGPWILLSLDTEGLKLRHPNGDTLTIPAPRPGERPPQLFAPQALLSTSTVPSISALQVPDASTVPGIFPLRK